LVNIFRKKSRKKIVATLLLAILSNYFMPLSVLAAEGTNLIADKMLNFESVLAEAQANNDEKILNCGTDNYCIKVTDNISKFLSEKSTVYDDFKLGITLSDLVDATSKPTDYDKLSDTKKATTIIYNTLTDVTDTFVKEEAYCEIELGTYDNEIDCTTNGGIWHAEVIEDVVINVESQTSLIEAYLDNLASDVSAYDDTNYLSNYEDAVAVLVDADKTTVVNEIALLKGKIDTATSDLTTVNGELETFKTNVVIGLNEYSDTNLFEYLGILDKLYDKVSNANSLVEDYADLINNEIYKELFDSEWETVTTDLTNSFNTLKTLLDNLTIDSLTELINEATDINNLSDVLSNEKNPLESLLSYINNNLPMVSSDNINKIISKLKEFYSLVSSDNNVIVNEEDLTISLPMASIYSKEQLETILSVDPSGSLVIDNFNELQNGTELAYLAKTGTTVTILVNDTELKTYTVSLSGDINGDGNVDGLDLETLESLVLGNTTTEDYSVSELKAMDYNGDFIYNITDIVVLYSYITSMVSGI